MVDEEEAPDRLLVALLFFDFVAALVALDLEAFVAERLDDCFDLDLKDVPLFVRGTLVAFEPLAVAPLFPDRLTALLDGELVALDFAVAVCVCVTVPLLREL